jgi:ATP-dependent HslUV protease subunit HslV
MEKGGTKMEGYHASTICAVRRDDGVCIGCDGQITRGEVIAKNGSKKVKRAKNYPIAYGVAGTNPDATVFGALFEDALKDSSGHMLTAAELLSEKIKVREGDRLDVMMIAADKDTMIVVSGEGDVMCPDENYYAIGSGGTYAQAAADALYHYTDLNAEEIVRASIKIASSICIYTNGNVSVERL